MLINADKPHLWKTDVTQSVYQFNAWFMEFAPVEYRNTRQATTEYVKNALIHTQDLAALTPAMLKAHPNVLPTLRMATAPPLARDRLIGLAGVNSSLVQTMEKNKLPKKMNAAELDRQLCRICEIISEVLDRDIFGWLDEGREAGEHERERTSMIVADRLCGSMADPIIRNAHEKRQLALIEALLAARGYRRVTPPPGQDIKQMTAGTYCYRLNVPVNVGERQFNIPIDVVIQPKITSESGMPILIEAKSAGDFTNTNKRRKEEAIKIQQLRQTYGAETRLYLFLCGYFDAGYLGYEASEGLDWIWEHRVEDLLQLGL